MSLVVSLVQFVIVGFPASLSVTRIHVVSVSHRQLGFSLSSSVFRLQGQCYRNTCGFSLSSSVWFQFVIVSFPASGSVLQEYMWFQSVIVSFPASVSVTGIHVVSVCHRQFSGFSVSECYRNTCGFGLSLFLATLVPVLHLVSFNKCQSPWRLLCPGDYMYKFRLRRPCYIRIFHTQLWVSGLVKVWLRFSVSFTDLVLLMLFKCRFVA